MFLCDVEEEKAAFSPEELRKHYERVGRWWDEHEKAGRIVSGVARRLLPGPTAKTLRVGRGTPKISDGPFAETKETVGGFGMLNVRDMQAAIDLVSTWPGLDETIEIRPVLSLPSQD
jgi:hypothetical protein